MSTVVAVAIEFAKLAPTLIDAGISIWSLWQKIRAALDAHAAPTDAQWQEADTAINALMARAMDPATDNR